MRIWFAYIVQCRGGSLYTGYTCDLGARVVAHNAGVGCKYTRSRTPVKLVYSKAYTDKSSAMKAEARIKKLSRENKDKLISNTNHMSQDESQYFETRG